jgi:hypothetical protein
MNSTDLDPTLKNQQRSEIQISIHKRPVNIEVIDLRMDQLSWQTETDTEKSINMIYQYAEAKSTQTINWYLGHKKQKAVCSRVLRFGAIVLTTLGGIAPVVSSIGWLGPRPNEIMGKAGYLLLATAAACVGLDKFFGISSGWMRYISAALSLQKAQSEFRLDWA